MRLLVVQNNGFPQLQGQLIAGSEQFLVVSEVEDGRVSHKSFKNGNTPDEALPYIVSAIFSTLHDLMENSQPHMLKTKEPRGWTEVKKFGLETGRLPLAFHYAILKGMERLRVTKLQGSATSLV